MKLRPVIFLLMAALVLAAVAGLCFGGVELSLAQLADASVGRGEPSVRVILWQLRLPRVLAGLLAGVGLSVAGVLLQSVTANALASPGIVGINSGAGLAVILLLTIAPAAGKLLPLGAFFGAFGAALLILLAASRWGGAKTEIVLIGIAVSTVFSAAISFLSLLDEGVLAQYNHFTVGSLKGVGMDALLLPAILIFLSLGVAMLLSSKLGVLCMGDAAASALGIRVKRLRMTALVCAAASAAAVVSFAGLLGFVGLIVPHIGKKLAGEQPARSLPVAALAGGVLVITADLLGRTLFAPSELPVGILMSLVGGPYFLILLCRRKHHAHV